MVQEKATSQTLSLTLHLDDWTRYFIHRGLDMQNGFKGY